MIFATAIEPMRDKLFRSSVSDGVWSRIVIQMPPLGEVHVLPNRPLPAVCSSEIAVKP